MNMFDKINLKNITYSSSEVVELQYSELEAATNSFAEDRVLGGGAFGTVYLANLSRLGAVAVKRLHSEPAAIPADPMHQFQNEVGRKCTFRLN